MELATDPQAHHHNPLLDFDCKVAFSSLAGDPLKGMNCKELRVPRRVAVRLSIDSLSHGLDIATMHRIAIVQPGQVNPQNPNQDRIKGPLCLFAD